MLNISVLVGIKTLLKYLISLNEEMEDSYKIIKMHAHKKSIIFFSRIFLHYEFLSHISLHNYVVWIASDVILECTENSVSRNALSSHDLSQQRTFSIAKSLSASNVTFVLIRIQSITVTIK